MLVVAGADTLFGVCVSASQKLYQLERQVPLGSPTPKARSLHQPVKLALSAWSPQTRRAQPWAVPFMELPIVMVTRDAVVKPGPHAALLKPAAGPAWAGVTPSELFGKILVSVHDAETRV